MGIRLKIAGLIQDQNYFDKEIKPLINLKIEYLGIVSDEKKINLMKNSRGLLHLNTYPEGFGLTLIEAMACGTPVIGMNRGSVPEVIEDKKTGFIVADIRQAQKAIKMIDKIERKACRERVEKYFSLDRMIDEYEQIYRKILSLRFHLRGGKALTPWSLN